MLNYSDPKQMNKPFLHSTHASGSAHLRLLLRLAGACERALRKARADRCSSFNWILELELSVTNRSRMSWI